MESDNLFLLINKKKRKADANKKSPFNTFCGIMLSVNILTADINKGYPGGNRLEGLCASFVISEYPWPPAIEVANT
jgi:hypothetical protein